MDIVEASLSLRFLERREARVAWRNWSQTFSTCGGGHWDCVNSDRSLLGAKAIATYQQLQSPTIYFGEPSDGFYEAESSKMPSYELWEKLYCEEYNDALYVWDEALTWTLIVHHEQFGGMVKGPILDCSEELGAPPWDRF